MIRHLSFEALFLDSFLRYTIEIYAKTDQDIKKEVLKVLDTTEYSTEKEQKWEELKRLIISTDLTKPITILT